MKRKNATRNALLTSIMSLLLCVSMLVGTTFAWFTDEVVTGMNTIAAGNLDIELLANGTEVDSNTKLFSAVEKWEPGVVVYENLQVANVGTLALKYQMTLNFGNENNLNGHKLSEVLKIAVIDKVADNATRADVLAAAKAAIDASNSDGSLSNFYLTGELEAGKSSTEQTVVIFWAPNDNAVDNLYNVNNDQVTSDGKPLRIEFGINLQATQKMHEEDSFGNDYDKFATILPKATVNPLGAQTVMATAGIGGEAAAYDLPFAMQFLPNETYEEAQASAYRYWHADYVVKADKAVPADSIALTGYYQAWCQYNNDNWVAMINEDADIDANTEIRLVELLGATVNYEEICNFGNDGIGFLCGAVDLTGQNVGTTITVELRMYETTIDPSAESGSANIETGEYKVIGRYSYTFGGKEVDTVEDLQAALNYGAAEIKLTNDIVLENSNIVVPAGNKTILDLNGKTITVANTNSAASCAIDNKGDLTIKNGTVTYEGVGDPNFGYGTNTINNTGKLVIDTGAVIVNTTNSGSSNAIDNAPGAELVVYDGTIKSEKVTIRLRDGSSATISGGVITGARAVQIHLFQNVDAETKLTITNGNLVGDYALYSYAYGNCTFAKTTVEISGGIFDGIVAFGGGNKTATETVSITGGTFNDDLGRYLANDGWEDIAKP